MQYTGAFLVIIGLVIIYFPQVIAWLLGSVFVFFGILLLFGWWKIRSHNRAQKMQFGKYEVVFKDTGNKS